MPSGSTLTRSTLPATPARVTREVAARLATLARNLELTYPAKQVAEFLTRCIFTSFADSVERLKPNKPWLRMLQDLRDHDRSAVFPHMASSLWATMNAGGFSPILQSHVLKFNGGLFDSPAGQQPAAIPLTPDQLNLLIEAADSNWRDVEPAIFGTLLERALDPAERHSLGAHYTPRAYVERLVIPTLVEPLRADWADILAAMSNQVNRNDIPGAIALGRAFLSQLCNTRVLDPACGSGNFLYVALEHLKRLEGEVLERLAQLGETQYNLEHLGVTVDPHQLLGIEINPRAAVVADLVLWIGYLQWHFRTRGDAQPAEPVIKNFRNIEHRDALLKWERRSELLDKEGNAVTEWDRITKIEHPITGKKVPDLTARRTVYTYKNPRIPAWPAADFIIGNPPYIGGKDVVLEFGKGYADLLKKLYPTVKRSADQVMYWWERAAILCQTHSIRRFGLITTNSISQVASRRVVARHLENSENPISILFAIPSHPWLKAPGASKKVAKSAAVRVAMTVASAGSHDGRLARVIAEHSATEEQVQVELVETRGYILPDLRIGANVAGCKALRANKGLCSPGVKLHGAGFIVTEQQASTLGMGRLPGISNYIRPYANGRDLAGTNRSVSVIDLFGMSIDSVREQFPEIYQWLSSHVKPEREANGRQAYIDKWWIFGEPRAKFRPALRGLLRFIATGETGKHRPFFFLPAEMIADNMLVTIASAEPCLLAIVSSAVHLTWTLTAGGTLEDRPRYTKTRCFDPFPFPVVEARLREVLAALGERLDAHRKRQQQLHPWLTLTDMYNVLEKLRAGTEFTGQDHTIYDAGLVGILREIHDDLDRAVFDAYGWPHDLTTEQILERIVALNAERRAEEAAGLVRWLRPEYQAPNAVAVTAPLAGLVEAEPAPTTRRRQPWPAALPEQVRLLKEAMRATRPQTPAELAQGFRPASRTRIQEILETLTALGQARESAGRYSL